MPAPEGSKARSQQAEEKTKTCQGFKAEEQKKSRTEEKSRREEQKNIT